MHLALKSTAYLTVYLYVHKEQWCDMYWMYRMLVKREILCEELTYNCVCFDMLVLCNIMNMYQAMYI